MKNKRGILASEALKMIIAVICIGLLFYLGFSLYGIAMQKTKVEQAKENLNQIFGEINSLEEGEKGDYLVTSPKEWYLVAYEEGENMPTQCKGENCLCLCPGEDLVERAKIMGEDSLPYGDYFYEKEQLAGYPTGGLDKCEKEGVCKEIINEIKIRDAYFGDRENPIQKGTTISFVNWISFYEIPKKLSLKKDKDIVYISDVEIDSIILSNFLNKKVEFEEENKTINVLINEMFDECSDENVGFLEAWKPKENKELLNLIKTESKTYLDELINKEEIKGGKIIFSSFDKIWFSNLIFVSEGDTKSCSVLEEKQICFNQINEERAIGGYIRFYTCD